MEQSFDRPQGNSPEEYRVFPEPPDPAALGQGPLSWRNVGAWGCLAWMIIYFFFGFLFVTVLLGTGLTDSPTGRRMLDWWIVPSGILAFTATIVVKLWRRRGERRELQQQALEARQSAEKEAKALTADLLQIRETSQQLIGQIPHDLDTAGTWLRSAEDHLSNNAPAPFWDAVQTSAAYLARCCSTSQELTRRVDRYASALRGRQHTFPPLPFQPTELPQPGSLIAKLQSIVGRGQTNASCATLWEEYKTHKMTPYGFSTLEQAITDLPEAVKAATTDLEKATSIDTDTG